MDLRDYFDFVAPDDIRLRGARVGIETVLYPYVEHGRSAEQIQRSYPALTLEHVCATVLYYLHNRKAVQRYLTGYDVHCRRAEAEYERHLPPTVQRTARPAAALLAAKQAGAAVRGDAVPTR